MALVLGVDVGGTSSKALLCDTAGAVLGRGDGPGGNVNSSAGDPAENITVAVRAALGDHDPAQVVAGMIGIAGVPAASARVRAIADTVWRSMNLPGSAMLGTDLDIAYAAGATGGDGVLLLAGTGAIAGAFRGYDMVRRCDGLGWLFGDDGSAVWFGLAAIRAALAGLDGRGPDTALAGLLAERMAPDEPTGDPRQDLIAVGYQWPPARFGELAPLVATAATGGDPVAAGIFHAGCAALIRTALTAAGLTESTDATAGSTAGGGVAGSAAGGGVAGSAAGGGGVGCVVLAGSMLTTAGPIADAVRAGLAPHFPSAPVTAPDPVAGAVLTALRGADLPVPADLPARLRTALRA